MINFEMKDNDFELFRERLSVLIGSGSARSFAAKAGVKETTLRGIINGSLPRLDTLLLIAKAGNVSVSWLTGEGDEPNFREGGSIYSISDSEFVQIPYYKAEISAGHGNYVNNEECKPLIFRRDWRGFNCISPDNLVGAHVPGDSMSPLILPGSDILIDIRKKHIEDGKIYVFNAGGDLLVKKIVISFNNYIAKSINKDYEDRVIEKSEIDALNIIGKAEISLPFVRL